MLATVVLSVPSLFVGFSNDDLGQRLQLDGGVPGFAGSWLGLYDFTPPIAPTSFQVDQGVLPWFTDPELRLRFLRPVTSATLALDHAWFGRNAVLAHLQSLLWLGLLTFAAARLYQRWFAAPAALLAALVFAISGVHAIPINWLAARHSLVAAACGLWGLWAWVRYREDGFKPGAALGLAGLCASLGSSETGLVAALLFAAYELGTRGRSGLRAAALPLGIGLVYLVLYAALGYGTEASSFYVSPFDAPLDYLVAVFWGAPALAAELLLGVPSILVGLGGRSAQVAFAVLGLGALAGSFLLLRALARVLSARTLRVLTWLSLAALTGLGALVGTLVSGRVLPLPLFAAAAVGGNTLWAAWQLARGKVGAPAGSSATLPEARQPQKRKRWWLAVALVALFQLVIPVSMRLLLPPEFERQGDEQRLLAENADVGNCATGGSLYVLNGADPSLMLYASAALAFYTPEKAKAERLRVVSMAPQAQSLTRTGPRVLELSVLGTPRGSNPFEQLFRAADHPLVAGQSVRLPELTVHVDETSAGLFTRARFEFTSAIDPKTTCLLVWRDRKLQNVAVPNVGESLRIEHELGPMGL